MFFIHDGSHEHIAIRNEAFLFGAPERYHHAGEPGFGVARTSTVEPTEFDFGHEGRNGHAIDGDRIHVGFQQESPIGVSTGEMCEHIRSPGQDIIDAIFDCGVPPEFGNGGGAARFTGTTGIECIDAVDSDQMFEQFDNIHICT